MPPLTWARLALVLLVAWLIQVTLLNQVVLYGAHTDVLVLFPAAAGLLGGAQRGAVVGFVTGLLADLVVQLPYGLSPLCFVIAGFGAGLLVSVPLGRDFIGYETISCAVLGTATVVLYLVVAALIGQHGMLGSQSVRAIVVTGLGALLFGFPVLASIRWCFAGAGRAGSLSVPSGGSALG